MNEKELQRLSQQAARAGMDAGTTTEAFRRVAEMPMPTRELANNSPEVDRDNGELISRQAAIDTVDEMPVMKDNNGIEFIEKSLAKTRLGLLPSAQPEQSEEVRCKDCGHFDEDEEFCDIFEWCVDGNEFYNRAEQTEGEAE